MYTSVLCERGPVKFLYDNNFRDSRKDKTLRSSYIMNNRNVKKQVELHDNIK